MGKGLLCALIIMLSLDQMTYGQRSIRKEKQPEIHAGLIVIKLKPEASSNGRIAATSQEHLNHLKKLVNYEDHRQVFAGQSFSNARVAKSGLQNIFKLKFDKGTNIWRELEIINKLDYIEYAEPYFINELMLVPNDPQADPNEGAQDYLSVIKAYEGWDLETSDSTMVIGIVDTGVKMDHEDLDNMAFNHADPINGIDDDGDGYIDNFHGWDVGDDDNDPTADGHPHGTHVTGISSAKTNNGIGIAGVGFKNRYLPVNAWNNTQNYFINEYEGIVYAADHGAKVINLSWGNPGFRSKYGQDIINYAVLEKDVVVVAAAGNTPEELDFYPASFDNVLSVGATDMNDNLASWATYSHFIDITAPGHDIYSTTNNGGYSKAGGTSFATPMVAGAAALVRSHFPSFTAQQVMEQLRVTSDDIYDVGSNMDYFGKIGRGRLNVQRAVSDILTPSIRVSEFNYEGSHGALVFPGDSVRIIFKFTNYLRLAENVTITISNPSSNVTWDVEQIYIAKLAEFENYENTESPISLIVNSNVSSNERILFRIDYVGNNYTDFEYVEIKAAPDFFDISDENISATITSDGDIGYDEMYYNKGNGITYKQDYIAANAGLIISIDSTHVMDNVLNNLEEFTRDEDFLTESALKLYDNSTAKYDARSVFIPYDTLPSKVDIKIEQKVLAWDNATDDGYLIFEYRIINTGDSAFSKLNAGLFMDWDLGDFQANEAVWDEVDKLGYVYNKTDNNLYSGLALITNQPSNHYAINIDSLNGNAQDIDTLFSDKLKHRFLAEYQKSMAGEIGDGNDVAHIVGGKGMTLQPNESIKVSFAMLASTSLDGLKSALNTAKIKYSEYISNQPVAETFFACDGDSALVDPAGDIYEFYEDAALTQRIDSGYAFKTPPVFMDQVYYMVNLDSGYASDVMKVMVRPGNPKAAFLMETDTLLIESGKSALLTIQDQSDLSDHWIWDFGNGYSSTVQHPSTVYDAAGSYKIELIVSNVYGCSDTTSQELLVANRSERALVDNIEICKGISTEIAASNTGQIEVYADDDLLHLLFEGSAFLTHDLFKDTAFYVVNSEGDFNSAATEVIVEVRHPEMGFDVHIDTTNLDEKYVLSIMNTSGPSDDVEWRVDNKVIGQGSVASYVYSDQPFEISQIKMDVAGCTDTLLIPVNPTPGALPVLEDTVICKHSTVVIKPENGNLYYFYKDSQLTNILHKGTSYMTSIEQDEKEVFVTGVDGLLESSSASIKLMPDPVKAIIETSADTIDIKESNSVELHDNSELALVSYWISPNGTFDTARVISDVYRETGAYEYMLVAESTMGCYDTTTQKIQVVNITGLAGWLNSEMSVYPNPVRDVVTIDMKDIAREKIHLVLTDVTGATIQTFYVQKDESMCQVSLLGLENGIYFIRSIHDELPLAVKILKQ